MNTFNFRRRTALVASGALLLSGIAQAQIDEIIVTANKREQTLQDIPVSVSVTTSEQIEQSAIVDLIDLQ
jgi:outer membrane receptor protein involved in Fe transport